jgi:hypothetical protein
MDVNTERIFKYLREVMASFPETVGNVKLLNYDSLFVCKVFKGKSAQQITHLCSMTVNPWQHQQEYRQNMPLILMAITQHLRSSPILKPLHPVENICHKFILLHGSEFCLHYLAAAKLFT